MTTHYITEAAMMTDSIIWTMENVLEKVEEVNDFWSDGTEDKLATLIYNDTLPQPDCLKGEVLVRLLREIVKVKYPGLPWVEEDWKRKARKSEESLVDLIMEFYETYHHSAAKLIRIAAVNTTRKMIPTDGRGPDRKRILKQSGNRLMFQLPGQGLVRYGRINHWNCQDELHALETVVRMAGEIPGVGPIEASKHATSLINTIKDWDLSNLSHKEEVKYCTLIPEIVAYKNGRFDVYLRDEKLATKVKEMLTEAE